MIKKIDQMRRIREVNKTYFNRNTTSNVQCEYCFRWLPDFNNYRFNHVRTCAAKNLFTPWLSTLTDIEVELYGCYKTKPIAAQSPPAYGFVDASNVDTDGDDGMNEMSQPKRVLFPQQTSASSHSIRSIADTSQTTADLDLDLDEELYDNDDNDDHDDHKHQEHLMMEQAIIQNIQDNTSEGRERMVSRAKQRAKRAKKAKRAIAASDSDHDMNTSLDDKVQKFKEIIDFTVVTGLEDTVRNFIMMS